MPGTKVKKPARECTVAELQQEIWFQLRRHLDDTFRRRLPGVDGAQLVPRPRASSPSPAGFDNEDPLVLPAVHSWAKRPESGTAIENLALAGDYVRSDWEVGNMEPPTRPAGGPPTSSSSAPVAGATGAAGSRCSGRPSSRRSSRSTPTAAHGLAEPARRLEDRGRAAAAGIPAAAPGATAHAAEVRSQLGPPGHRPASLHRGEGASDQPGSAWTRSPSQWRRGAATTSARSRPWSTTPWR